MLLPHVLLQLLKPGENLWLGTARALWRQQMSNPKTLKKTKHPSLISDKGAFMLCTCVSFSGDSADSGKVDNSRARGTVRNTKKKPPVDKFVPVLGINFLIAEVDIVLLLTVKSMIGQTRERLYLVHEYHLKRTTQAL